MTRPLLLLFFLSLGASLPAQTLPSRRYTSRDGLSSDRITTMAQDSSGFLWFGSYFGISRYTGLSFEKVPLPASQQNKYVNFLVPVKNTVYAGFLFGGGLAACRPDGVTAYTVAGRNAASCNEFTCAAVLEDESLLLANSARQIYRFRDGRFSLLFTLPASFPGYPQGILRDRTGAVWLASDSGLCMVDLQRKEVWWRYPGERITTLQKDRSGTIWLAHAGSRGTVIETMAGFAAGKFLDYRLRLQKPNLLYVPFSGNLSEGVWALDPARGLLSAAGATDFYLPVAGLGTDIRAVYCDRERNLWIADEPGVVKLTGRSIRTYPFSEPAAAGGALLQLSDTILLVNNARSLYRLSPDRIGKQPLPAHSPDYFGLMRKDRAGRIWIGYWNGGILRTEWTGGKPARTRFLKEFDGVPIKAQAMVEDGEGNSWIGGANSLFYLRNGDVVAHDPLPNSGGFPTFISCMVLDTSSKTLWLGDNALGVTEVAYEIDKKGRCRYRVKSYIDTHSGLTDSYVRSLFLDHTGTLWIGTRSGGIFRLPLTAGKRILHSCNAEARLECNRITDIVPQGKDALWFAACDGLYRYQFADGSWKHLTTSDGLLNAEVFGLTVDAQNGWVWALSSGGVTRLSLGHTELPPPPPLVTLTGIQVLGKPDPEALQGSRTYSYTHNSISFQFAGASFLDEKKIRYRYRLSGYDPHWSEAVSSNGVSYASLPPGHYVFEVLASNAQGSWSVKPARFSFEIVLPFYRRPWFLFLTASFLLFVLYLVRIQRLQQKYRIEKLRLSIARDLHDDVGSTLGSINILSKTATRKLEKLAAGEEMVPIFDRIGQSAEHTLEAMDDIVWAINPAKDKLEDLVLRMRAFAIPLLEAAGITFRFEVDGAATLSLPMELRRNVFLLFKEAVYNLLRHAEASEAFIRLAIAHNRFLLEVRDNGKGFSTGQPTERNGLKNMQARAKGAGGEIQILSDSTGTEVRFSAPLR